jgi:hypothetical protein
LRREDKTREDERRKDPHLVGYVINEEVEVIRWEKKERCVDELRMKGRKSFGYLLLYIQLYTCLQSYIPY